MCFTSAAKTAALQGTKRNGRNDKIQVSSAGVLTRKTKSSRQPKMASTQLRASLVGKESILTAGSSTSTGSSHALLMKCSERKFCYSIVFSSLHVNKIQSSGYKILAWFHQFLYSKKEAPRVKRFSSAETMRM